MSYFDSGGDPREIAYLSTFIDVAAPVATARFDALLTSLGTSHGVLELHDKPTWTSSALRSVPGTLRSPRGRNLGAVLIELEVWSQGRTQIGVRPSRNKSGSAAAYFSAGNAVLTELAQALSVERPEPLGLIAMKRQVVPVGRRARARSLTA